MGEGESRGQANGGGPHLSPWIFGVFEALARLTGDRLLLVNSAGELLVSTEPGLVLPPESSSTIQRRVLAPRRRDPAEVQACCCGGPSAEDPAPCLGAFEIEVRVRSHETEWRQVHATTFHVGPDTYAVLRFEPPLAPSESTEATERDRAVEANLAKTRFVANMCHEIRTPLNAVTGMTGLLLETRLSEEQKELVETIRTSSDALLDLVNDALDLSKIEAGRLELESWPMDIVDCVEESLDLVASKARENEVELIPRIERDVPTSVYGDSARLRQVLLNLLSNAVKFTREGDVVVTVSRVDASTLQFSVRDTGIGIPKDRLAFLFQAYSQANLRMTRKYGGTGLGLSIARHIVERMGGTIRVESEVNKGSTFAFTLPCFSAPRRRTPLDDTALLEGKRVFVASAHREFGESLSLRLQDLGMTVTTLVPTDIEAGQGLGAPFDIGIVDCPKGGLGTLDEETVRRQMRWAGHLVILKPLERRSGGAELSGPPRGIKGTVAWVQKPAKTVPLAETMIRLLKRSEDSSRPSLREMAAVSLVPTQALHRILLVEDQAINQKVATKMLSRMGYRADLANDGLEALEAMERQAYDIVLMDLQMPNLDGLEATQAIHRRWPPGERPWIIAMTASAFERDRELCVEAGMNDYISKPIGAKELEMALARAKPGSKRELGYAGLDPHVLESLRALGAKAGTNLLAEISDQFFRDAPYRLEAIRGAIEKREQRTFLALAHGLKGTAGTLGAWLFASRCRELEQLGIKELFGEASVVVSGLEKELWVLRRALWRELDRPSAFPVPHSSPGP